MKKICIVIGLLWAGFASGQELPKKPPTFTTTREFRPDPKLPAGGHIVYFYDHAKYKAKEALLPQKFIDAKALPPAPATFDFGVGVDYPMLLNDQLGCCFYASICHHDQTMTGNWTTQSQFNLATFRQRYLALSGGDNGLSDPDVQGEWKNRYLADVTQAKIVDWLYVDTTNPAAISSAMYHFGGAQFTFVVPQAWINNSNTGDIWDAPSFRNNNNGHAVHWAGVNDKGHYKLVTWGTYVWITPAGVKVCDPSGFVVFSTRWFDAKGYAPNKKHITELAKVWSDAGGKVIPASVISAFPPPGVTPPDPIPPTPIPPENLPTITLDKPLPAGKYQIAPLGKLVVDPDDLRTLKDALDKLLQGKKTPKINPPVESPVEKKSGLSADEMKMLLVEMKNIGERLDKFESRLDIGKSEAKLIVKVDAGATVLIDKKVFQTSGGVRTFTFDFEGYEEKGHSYAVRVGNDERRVAIWRGAVVTEDFRKFAGR